MTRSLIMTAMAAMATLVLAAAPASAAGKSKSHAVHAQSLVGTLEKVDGSTLTIKTAKGPETVMLASAAHIRQNGKAIQPAQLSSATGAHVKVRYADHNGQRQADLVTVSAKTNHGSKS